MAAISPGILWTKPPSVILDGLDRYERDLLKAVEMLLRYYSPQLESHAKAYAPWTDRTGNARQGLFSVVDPTLGKVTLYLCHTMEYGVYLELRWQGKYAILMPTLQQFTGPIGASLKALMKR